MTDNGQIMAILMQLYEVVDGEVLLSDAVSRDFEGLSHNQVSIVKDDEWAALLADVPLKRKDADDNPNRKSQLNTNNCVLKRMCWWQSHANLGLQDERANSCTSE